MYCNKRFKAYLYGRHCKLIVDDEPLVTMRKLKEPAGRIGNLLNKLQDCDYEMIYQPGPLHVTPDLLLSPPKQAIKDNVVKMTFEACINRGKEQNADEKVSEILKILETGNKDVMV